MIKRVSEVPFWGPEEQIRRFINQHDVNAYQVFDSATTAQLDATLDKLGCSRTGSSGYNGKTDAWKRAKIKELIKNKTPTSYSEEQKEEYFKNELGRYFPYQLTVTQARIENIDDIFQKQLIWSYGQHVDDAYFYWDWCPVGTGTDTSDPKWQIVEWNEHPYNLLRDIDRVFDYTKFSGYRNKLLPRKLDEMVDPYNAEDDVHAKRGDDSTEGSITTLDRDTLRHNIMRSYIEVSEWLGDGATKYGSHNGYVSRKMSMTWLFNAIRALINWKLANQDKWAEVDIKPLTLYTANERNEFGHVIHEGFLGGEVTKSTQDVAYEDWKDLDQSDGRCGLQEKVRAKHPDINGVQKVRGNEYHYGERADFYTHTSFIGECRFFHNARFLGQTTFDKEINGTAMRSRWADLAEFKESDKAYEPGTLVMFGGEKEITLSRKGVCNAIVTTKPGFMLNADEPSKNCIMVGIALTGTVPVKIVGKVKKFDRLVASSTYPGCARAKKWYDFFKKPIAIALENSEPFGDFVNCITKMEF